MIQNPLKQISSVLKSLKADDTRQKEYFLMLEKTCNVNKAIFIDRNVEKWQAVQKQIEVPVWAVDDDKLVTASNITEQNIVGRYRIDNTNSDGIFELWFDIDANKDLRSKDDVKNSWKTLEKAGNRLIGALNAFGVGNEFIQIKPSGRGLQFSVFCSGFRDEKQYNQAMLCIQKLSGLSMNIKQSESKGVVFGFDSPAIGSSRRKIRDIGGQNDKLAGMVHYVSTISTFDGKSYPFVTKAKDVIYPSEIKIFKIDKDFINKIHEMETFSDVKDFVQTEGTVEYQRDGDIQKFYQVCPLLAKIEKDAKSGIHITNPQRIFLSQTFTFFGEAGEQEVHRILSLDPDYSETYTQNQLDNVKKNNRKPITCAWAKERNLCPECKGLKCKSPVSMVWKPPQLEELKESISRHVKLVAENTDVIDFLLATGLEREYWPEGDALWVYLVASSGSGKTELMRLMNSWKRTYTVDELTKASMISGFKPEEGTFGILKHFDGKSVYVKDMSQILTANKDERNAVFGTLRNVYDGYVEKGFGNTKEKIRIESKFGLFIGMTPIIDAYYTLSNQLGERFIKVRFTCEEDVVLSDIFDQQNDEYIAERKRLQRKVNEFLSSVQIRQYDPPVEFKNLLIGLVKFTASMRTAVYVQTEGESISFRGEREMPSRVLNQSKKLWTLLACVRGKDKVGKEEIDFVAKALLQTPPLYRIQAFYHLLKSEKTTVQSLADAMRLYHTKAEQILQELYYLRIVVQNDDDSYSLLPEFRSYGEAYEKLGWYKWLHTAYSELIQMKKVIPEKRRERGIDQDWLKGKDDVTAE
ncbi:MAG: hypothetical protein WC365_06420 [Candidatus Babeliales bacterium]|jgi:hypothetical protein